MARDADDARRAGHRRMDRDVSRRRARLARVHDRRWVDPFLTWRRDLESRRAPARTCRSSCSKGAVLRARGGRAAPNRSAPVRRRGLAARRRPTCSALDARGLARRAIALADELARRDARVTPIGRHATTSRPSARLGRSRAGALRRVVRDVSALGRTGPDAQRDFREAARAPAARSPIWVSTSSICRRFTRSAAASGRAATTRSSPEPGDPGQPVGDRLGRGRPHGGRARPRHARRLRGVPRAKPSASASRSRSTSRCSARPITPGSASIPSGSAIGPTARSSTRRTRRRNTRTSTRSTSAATTGGRSGRRCSTSTRFWVARGVRIFRVDNPHTKPFGFWEWLIDAGARALPRRDLPVRGVHPAEGDAVSGQGWLHAVVHLLHLAEHEGRSSTSYFTELTDADAARVPAAEPLREHARHPARLPAGRAAGRRSRRGSCSRRRSAPATASTAASSCARAARGPGTEEYADSEKYQIPPVGLGTAGPHQGADRACQPAPPGRARAADRPARLQFHDDRQPDLIAFSKRPDAQARPTAARAGRSELLLMVVNLDPHRMQHGFVRVPLHLLGRAAEPDRITRPRDLLDQAVYRGGASGTTCGSTRACGRDIF